MLTQDPSVPSIVLRTANHLASDYEVSWEKTEMTGYHGGDQSDEIAALVSLALGMRLQAGGLTRTGSPNDHAAGSPRAYESNLTPFLPKGAKLTPMLPRLHGQRTLSFPAFVTCYPHLSVKDSRTLVRAARLYQDAVWIADSEPHLSWLLLVTAIETAAIQWKAEKATPTERLQLGIPELTEKLDVAGGQELVDYVAEQIADMLGSTVKFVSFLLEHLPPPPDKRPPPFVQVAWDPKTLKGDFRKIYSARSKALHDGIPVPAPMCFPPELFENVPAEKSWSTAGGAWSTTWLGKDTPMLLGTFEYIARHALLKWWQRLPLRPVLDCNF